MSDNAVHQIISAYATGCLDRDNFIQFMNFVNEGGDVPKGEMGELQNVIALIPTLLELELAPEDLKNQVAKQILEIEAQRKREEKQRLERKLQPVVPQAAPQIVSADKSPKTAEKQVGVSEESNLNEAEIKHEKTLPVKTEEKGWFKQNLPLILISVIGLLLVLLSYYFYSLNMEFQTELEDASNQISGLRGEISNTNKFLNEHIDLLEFLNYKNVEMINFLPTEAKPDAHGKLFISFEVGEAILQLKNLPKLTAVESYQLWMVSPEQSYSLGTVFIRPELEYYKLTNIPFLEKKDISMFRITKESRSGSEVPQGQLYLFGSFYRPPEPVNPRRK